MSSCAKRKKMRMESEDMNLCHSTLTAFSGLHSPLQEVYRHFNFSSTHLYI